MAKQVVEIILTFHANLDPVPGTYDNPQDWEQWVKQKLSRLSHYNSGCTIHSTDITTVDWSKSNE